MSLQSKILSLLSGVTDVTLRMDVASTINYLFQLYEAGEIEEQRIRRELWGVCYDVVRALHPELTDSEVKDESSKLEDEFIKIFRLESARRRIFTRLRRSRESMV